MAVARRSLGRSLAPVDEASDFLQETFVAARQAELKGRRPPAVDRLEAAWLRTILKRKISEEMRRRKCPKHGGAVEVDTLAEAIAGSATSPSEAYQRKVKIEAVRRALSRLPPRSRMVLIWQVGEGMTCKDIGERLGVASSYVSRIRDNALEQLKRAYCEVGDPSGLS